VTPSPAGQARALRAAALLLGYPDDELFARMPVIREAVATLPEPSLARFVAHVETSSRADLERAYVDTFDLRRRCCLYLTYYSYGDTRKRGMALLRFTHAYRSAGFELLDGELPDHLGVVCEFAAAQPREGLRLLAEHRAAVELLRLALADAGSAYVDVVDGIRAVLPEAAPKDLERALLLAQTGPPAEEVGLEPFGPPELMGTSSEGARR
jgi:nitrate reductase delta subunit